MGSIKLTVTISLCDMIIVALLITVVAGLDRDVSTMRNLTITPRKMRQVPALPCGSRADLDEDEEVTLESPNYPNEYPSRAKCKWILMVPAGKEVQVYCESFHIERGAFLRIGSDRWYGNAYGEFSLIVPTGGELGDPQQRLKVVFKSNSRRQGTGFRCTFDVESETGGSTEATVATTAPTTAPAGTCQCGIKGGTQTDRIVGGQEAEQHEYPWQVGLVSRNGKTPWCGGTLISDRHIMTAAHCTAGKTPASIQILLGEHRTNDDVFTRVDASKINDDPNYSMPNNDFSILTLTNPVTFTSSIRPACLPATTDKTYAEELATVTGWGTLSSGGNQPTVLMEVDVTVTTNEYCNMVYGSAINDLHICAMDPGKDACQGDSGGPLVVKENDRWTLIGVVSFGYGCAQPDIPGVYARITQRMDWIKENTAGTYTSTCQAN